jgi:hypothetical protein
LKLLPKYLNDISLRNDNNINTRNRYYSICSNESFVKSKKNIIFGLTK